MRMSLSFRDDNKKRLFSAIFVSTERQLRIAERWQCNGKNERDMTTIDCGGGPR